MDNVLYKILAAFSRVQLELDVNAYVQAGTGWRAEGGLVILPSDLAAPMPPTPRFMQTLVRDPR